MQPSEIIDAANASSQSTKTIEHNNGDDGRARQRQATDVACGVEPIFNSITFMSCYVECTAVASSENRILNPNIELAVRFKLRQDI